jgi:uncharacterized membrane protein YcaP (DUF421 family)
MEVIDEIFGSGKDLTSAQMACRGVLVFFIALVLLRISGRRSFGLGTPLDNIITISLGAILSRGIVGASPFLPVIVTSLVIVVLHRFIGWLALHNNHIDSFIEGEKILVFEDGRFLKDNMKRALICDDDLMRGIRRSALTEDLRKIKRVYMERNGELSIIKEES